MKGIKNISSNPAKGHGNIYGEKLPARMDHAPFGMVKISFLTEHRSARRL